METLRQESGVSGFLKRTESEYDVFGPATPRRRSPPRSASRRRDLLGESFKVAAVIGDGSLGCGLAYEGLNNAGDSGAT
jgi:1-deoxy-D-xylulose-5-phosphate synthase